ncbi:MAG: ADP-forming succinate--CoA ligase subunit beta [Gemmatimonadetes bacterium]|nr:ADP-forming succinate--CoA ligase subunit beta [Gemmatimonadota bacterium]
MKLHEYQAKDVFRSFGIPVPPGRVATTAGEAGEIAREYGRPVVVKAQVHVGGRGKAGGVKLAQDPAEARARAQAILGMDIKGLTVRRVLVTPAEEIASEAYAAVILDRAARCATFMVSRAGGVDIEQVAAETPELIVRLSVDPRYGLLEHQALGLGLALYDDLRQARAAAGIFGALWRVFLERDASLAEINPLVTTPAGDVVALDAKLVIDDNALFRQRELEALHDPEGEEPAELQARAAGLSYVKLEGSIGCIVNGAGLAMATMDLIQYYGGDPANFLDIGGSSNPDKVLNAMRILLGDPHVEAVLFNIFGGITRCDDVANGLVAALDQIKPDVPIAIRLTGTNEEEALEILRAVGLPATSSMDEVVQRAIELARERTSAAGRQAVAGRQAGGGSSR